jgi:uroporphyrinogen decarboxylase
MNDTFLKACRGEEVSHTPIWIMRQAGRYLNEYQKIRKKVDFLTLCKTPERAAEVTIQPIDILGVDAAILFSDILIPLEAMGMKLEFHEKRGPVFEAPIRGEESVAGLEVPEPDEVVGFVMDTIKILRRELSTRVPLIGFSGAPLTLATYMIEGGTSKNFLHTKQMIFQRPDLYAALMKKVTGMTTAYLKSQIRAGAQAVQIFDTWAGILSPRDFVDFALRYVQEIISELKEWMNREGRENVPVIYFVGQCSGLLEEIRNSGADVIGVDWRIDMDRAIKRAGENYSYQGNLDPCALFLPVDKIEERVKDILGRASSARGHIFNLGHGVLPETPVEHVVALVEAVHRLSERQA